MSLDGLDWGAFSFFHNQAVHRFSALRPIMTMGNGLGEYFVILPLVLAAAGIFFWAGQRRPGSVVLLTLLVGIFLVELVRYSCPRPRPEDAADWVSPEELSRSFPSRNLFLFTLAILMVAMALEKNLFKGKAFNILHGITALLILWVMLSQLFLGLHYLTDILAGLAGGIALALFTRWVAFPSGSAS